MEIKTFNVMFYIRRTRTNRRGEAPVLMKITVDGVRVDTTIRKTIDPNLWDSVRGKAIEKTTEARELNLYMDAIRFRITRIQREMELDSTEYVTAQMVLNRWLGRDAVERHTLVEVFREHNEKCQALSGIDMAPATVQRYETCLKHTQEFMLHTYGKDDIYLDELDRQFVVDYEFFLKTEKKCCHNKNCKVVAASRFSLRGLFAPERQCHFAPFREYIMPPTPKNLAYLILVQRLVATNGEWIGVEINRQKSNPLVMGSSYAPPKTIRNV